MAGLLKEKRRLIGAAAGFYRIAGVVPDVAGDAVAAGFQAVAVSLQSPDGALHNPVLLQGGAHVAPC